VLGYSSMNLVGGIKTTVLLPDTTQKIPLVGLARSPVKTPGLSMANSTSAFSVK
jgi:hypothetical protein